LYPIIERKLLLSPLTFLYISQILVPVLVFFYINYKKTKYSKVFLRRIYRPSNKLLLVMASLELPLIFGMYFYLFANSTSVFLYCVVIIHTLLVLCGYVYVYTKANRYRGRINSFENNFKLGVLAVGIGDEGEHGLEKGGIVKIVRRLTDGYLVKNSKGEEFIVKLSDIEEIIDIV
ncbi:hypothetical protein PAEPH01_2839, partial [Pancytospora epiphaga]